jgi:hypothetical protein
VSADEINDDDDDADDDGNDDALPISVRANTFLTMKAISLFFYFFIF